MARKRRKKSNQNRYFTIITEMAILAYNKLPREQEYRRHRIYRRFIYPAFSKMAEILIHKYKFYYIDSNVEVTKQMAVTFLTEKIHMYTDPSRGRAYSYFTRTCYIYLVNANTQAYSNKIHHNDLNVVDDEPSVINDYENDQQQALLRDFTNEFVAYMEDNMAYIFTTTEDIKVADAILELFRKRDLLEIFNKKALYLLIREYTGLETHNITKVMKVYKKLYYEMLDEYRVTGSLNNFKADIYLKTNGKK